MLKVTYISHSGFLVETDSCCLLFDYWKGKLPSIDPDKSLYVFASHAHPDHYSDKIFELESSCRAVRYILSDDIRKASAKRPFGASHAKKDICYMKSGEKLAVGDCRIRTLRSTDEGVAFIVEADGHSIYHAGDLQWWDWPGEPEEENEDFRRRYCAEIDSIAGEHFDAAFVVLDPRQEGSAGLGMEYFMEKVAADRIFPMHLWDDYGLIGRFKRGHAGLAQVEKVVEIGAPGEVFEC